MLAPTTASSKSSLYAIRILLPDENCRAELADQRINLVPVHRSTKLGDYVCKRIITNFCANENVFSRKFTDALNYLEVRPPLHKCGFQNANFNMNKQSLKILKSKN